jgi:hypothetical protein
MHINQQIVIFYLLFWLVRINGCFRRWRQPLLRGPEYFFDVHAQPDFYTGAGKKILHRYWIRMFIPFAVDIPLAITIFLSGRFLLLEALILGLCVLIHVNHSFSVNLAERQAQPFAVPEDDQPVASVNLSLAPRRMRDYTNFKLEWVLGVATLIAFAWLVRYYYAAPEHHNLRQVFAAPFLLLYMQVGMLFAKRVVLAWRTPIPQFQAAEHMEAREETRRHYLKVCDWNRATITACILFWPIKISVSPFGLNRLLEIWFAAWMVIAIAATIWVEIRRKHLVKVALRARPVKVPDFLGESEIAKWPVCYQPSAPMLVLKGAAYLVGWVALIIFLPQRH